MKKMHPTHACPGGCRTQVPYARLACPPCWTRLPLPLKLEVSDSYRRRALDPVRHLKAVGDVGRWYREQWESL